MLRNIINTLFGTGRKTEVHQKPIISEADSVKDSISETPIPQLSVDLGDPEVKIKLLGSIFPEKIYFDGKKYRTSRFNHLLSIIFHETKHLQGQKKMESPEKSENSTWVARRGIEPLFKV